VIVQVVFAARGKTPIEIGLVALADEVPGHPGPKVGPPVIVIPAGIVSFNKAEDMATLLGFCKPIVIVVVPFSGTLGTANDFVATGGASTVSVAVLEVTLEMLVAPAEVLFGYMPRTELVTLTVTVHEPLAATVPPVSTMLDEPAGGPGTPEPFCRTPPQVVAAPVGLATTRFAGN